LEIIYYNTIPSTQKFLIDEIEKGHLIAPIAIIAEEQTDGIGSGENSWVSQKGNLFASFALPVQSLPDDLPILSSSIYFGAIMSEILKNISNDIWLKWPNDIYLKKNKIAGIITKKLANTLVCGIGVNIVKHSDDYACIGCDITPIELLEIYLKKIEKFSTWKQVFSKVQLEFHKNKKFYLDIEKYKDTIGNAILSEDGSMIINGEKVYSLR